MKNIIKKLAIPVLSIAFFAGCSKFDELTVNPLGATEEQVQVEYFINGAIINAQMDPHIAERIYVLYWMTAGGLQQGGGIATGGYNDGWSSDYFGRSFMAGWLSAINAGIKVAETNIATGNIKEYTGNLLQVSRIWRAYLLSEASDNFGPIPLDGFNGENPSYSNVKDVYYFLLSELKDASSKLDLNIIAPEGIRKFDPAYSFDFAKWQKYANSMRLRLSMRLSEVDETKARSEFEDAADEPLLTEMSGAFRIAERAGWDALTGEMTREWNSFPLSQTLNNLYKGLGGIPSADQLGASFDASIKPQGYVGVLLNQHFTQLTNDPTAGYWLDGLPYSIDPRAYKTFIVPGDFTNPNFNAYPSWDNSAKTTTGVLLNADGSEFREVDANYTWNARVNGDWGAKGALNQLSGLNGTTPRLANNFRNSTNSRIFFAPWETDFLLAEAAVRGWATPVDAETAYENGVKANFEYWNLSSWVSDYLSSDDYNLVGTSVSWNHTTEPGATHSMSYKNGYTNATGNVDIAYPVNTIYEGGAVRNDHLTKIITQKFIAQAPYLPLETWNDRRRLGLPFFENPAVENPLSNMPALTSGTYMTSSPSFFPQRIKYPSSLVNSNAVGYEQAVSQLGGPDDVLTPLWWAKKP